MTYLLPTTNNTVPVTGLVNATVTSSGSFTLANIGAKEVNLIINVSGTVTGTLPTLTFTLTEIDPGNTTTTVTGGTTVTGAWISATGTQTLKLADTTTGAIKVTWAIGGTGTPTFNGVYATITLKNTEDVIEQFIPSAEDNTLNVIAHVIKPLASAAYSPTYLQFIGTGFGAAAAAIVKSSTGNIRSFKATNRNASSRYLQLFNSTSLPASGTTACQDQFLVPTGSMIIIGEDFFSTSGVNFSSGIVFAFSSGTTATYSSTGITATDHDFSITYI